MSKNEGNQLGIVLTHTGELLAYILPFLALLAEWQTGNLQKNAIQISLVLGLFLLVLAYFRKFSKSEYREKNKFLLISYFFVIAFMQLFVLPLNSPYIYLSLLLVALSFYSFGDAGIIISALVTSSILVWSYITILGKELSNLIFAQMLSHLAIYIVLVYLIRGLLKISSSQVNQVSQQTQDAKLEHQRLLALVNNIGDAVVATDHEGHIQTYNGAALELIDTNKSLTGMYLRDAWKIVDQTGLNVDVIEEARSQNRTIRRSDLMLQYSKNDVANIYINVTPIKIGYGLTSEEGYTLIVRDITKEKSLDEERDEFISVVSHELRTPVTITEGKISNAQLLLSKSNNPDKNIKQSLLESHDQVVFLASMINDLANLSRAERVDSKIPRDKIIPAELVKTLASSYKIEAHQHKLELKTEISPEPIPDLYTSRLYLLEILQNFTTNAFKYTKTGRVTLGVKPTDRNSVTFYVADTGIGVSISDQKRLFEKFFRSEDYRTRESSGTGLGLYVTTKLAQKLGAKLSVNSKLNEGSIFSVTVGSLPDDSNPRD